MTQIKKQQYKRLSRQARNRARARREIVQTHCSDNVARAYRALTDFKQTHFQEFQ